MAPDRGPFGDSQLVPTISEASTKIGKDESSLRKTVKLYRAAIWWSIAFSATMIMEYYTNAMATMFFAQDAFLDYFGGKDGAPPNEVSQFWMFSIGFVNIFGCFLGSLFNGWFSEKFGQRKAAIFGLLMLDGGLAVGFFATELWHLALSNLVIGIPFGMFSNLGITYAADVCPPRVRGYLVSFANICHILGQLVATVLLFLLAPLPGLWAFRIPWGLTWITGIGLLVIYWAPESPVWLVRRGRPEKARVSLVRLMRNDTPGEIDARLRVIQDLNEEEKAIAVKISFKQCFQRENRRLTFLTCLVALCGWASGNAMIGHAVYFLKTVGITDDWDYFFPLFQCVLGIAATIAGGALLDVAGRRTIWLGGLIGCICVLTALGFTGLALGIWEGVPTNEPAAWVCAALVLVYAIVRNLTTGPVSQVLFTELPTVRLRQKVTAIARSLQFVTSMVNTIALPVLLNPGAMNLSARAGFIFAGLSLIGLLLSWLLIPETKINIKKEQRRLENTGSLTQS